MNIKDGLELRFENIQFAVFQQFYLLNTLTQQYFRLGTQSK